MMIDNKEYKESGQYWLGVIPQRWGCVPLKTIFNRRSQKNNPIISRERLSLSIDKGITLYADKTTNLDRFKDDFTQYQLAYPGDIVLNCMNMIVGAIGLSPYFGCVSPVYYVIYPRTKNASVDFYNYLLNISSIKDLYRSLGQGIYAIDRGDGRVNTCRLKVSYDDFGQIKIPVPNIKEQEAIADFLDVKCAEVDELIALQRQMIDELKVYKQSVITEAVTKGLNPDAPLKDSGIEWIGQIPEHWSVERLKNRIHKSFAGIWGDDAQNNDKDVRCYRVADFDYNQLNISDDNPTKRNIEKSVFEQRKVLFNDILLEKSGGGEKSPVGRAVYVNLQEEAVCSNFVHCIRVNENSVSKFMVYIFSDMYSRKVNLLYFNQTTGIQNLNISDYLNNTVGFPPLEEQQQIADYLDTKCAEIDEMTSIKQQKIEQLKEYKKSIIYEYVTGKKQVNIE